MKQHRQDLTTRIRDLSGIFCIPVYLCILAILLFHSCHNDIETIKALSDDLNLPNQSGKNFEVQYTDSGKLLVIFKAPLVERYIKKGDKGSYYEFNKGIEILFFDKNEMLESIVTARHGLYYEDKNLGVASDSVVGTNIRTDEQLNTEELFWDRENRTIYSHVFTKITNEDGVFYGEKGFESDQDFDNYKLIGSSGTVRVRDEEIQ